METSESVGRRRRATRIAWHLKAAKNTCLSVVPSCATHFRSLQPDAKKPPTPTTSAREVESISVFHLGVVLFRDNAVLETKRQTVPEGPRRLRKGRIYPKHSTHSPPDQPSAGLWPGVVGFVPVSFDTRNTGGASLKLTGACGPATPASKPGGPSLQLKAIDHRHHSAPHRRRPSLHRRHSAAFLVPRSRSRFPNSPLSAVESHRPESQPETRLLFSHGLSSRQQLSASRIPIPHPPPSIPPSRPRPSLD